MPVSVRPARPDDDRVSDLLYVSAAPYYNAYAGSAQRALRVLGAVYPRRAHTASYEICHVAELRGKVVGAMAAFPAPNGERLARRFLGLTLPRLPVWRWPIVLRHLQASAEVTPSPPPDALYVDALAVAEEARRQGVATALLATADELARDAGVAGVALDTGLENTAAQALYDTIGFERRGERRAPDARVARAVGGFGFVSFFRGV